MRRPDLVTCRIGDEIVILDRAAGRVHQLNATATFIWQICDGEHSLEEIVKRMTAAFEAPPEGVVQDVLTALEEFKRLGLLVDQHPTIAAQPTKEERT